MLITADSQRTSNPTPTPKARFVSPHGLDDVGKTATPHVVISKRYFYGGSAFGLLEVASCARETYNAHVQVNSSTGTAFFSATPGRFADIVGTYAISGVLEPLQQRIINIPYLTQGAELAAVTSIEA